jgi:hypothetical protein
MNNLSIAIIAIVAALALLGVQVLTVAVTISSLQQAEASTGGVPGHPPGTGCQFT